MNVPVLPENAPFTATQRAWLNGFLAGWLGTGVNGHNAPAELNGHATNGATLTLPALEAEEDFPWHDSALPLDERLKLAEDKPIERRLMAAMAQLDCGACGYVCKTYSEAIANGEETDLSRCSPGGKETMVQLKTLWAGHKNEHLATNGKTNGAVPHVNGNGQKNGAALTNGATISLAGTHRNMPLAATLLETRPLNGLNSTKDTRQVVLDLQNSGLKYTAGDSLGVLPLNHPDLVNDILAVLELDGRQVVQSTRHGSHDLRWLLSRKCTLTKPSSELFELLARTATEANEVERLQSLCSDEADDPLTRCDLLDLLTTFPTARPDIVDLVDALTPLQPRLYSIASSLKAHPNQVHLTVGVVSYEHHGRIRRGVASHFLGQWAKVGQEVEVFVHPSKFRLPAEQATSVIMVGPGTGIAPFRAFLQERAVTGATGPNWLFFGNPCQADDFLYRDELEGYQRRGVLNRLDTAFSRDQAEKLYVQHRMLEQAAELWKWLSDGAHFYVCGDAQRMARDVDHALHQIVAEQGGMTAEQAKAWVAQLSKSGRYQRDVY